MNSEDLINNIKIPDINIDDELKQSKKCIDDAINIVDIPNLDPILNDMNDILDESFKNTTNKDLSIPNKI